MPPYHPYSCLLATLTVAHCQKIPSPRPCILPVVPPPLTTYLSHCGSFLEDTILQQATHPSYSPTSTMDHSWKIPSHQTTYPYCLPTMRCGSFLEDTILPHRLLFPIYPHPYSSFVEATFPTRQPHLLSPPILLWLIPGTYHLPTPSNFPASPIHSGSFLEDTISPHHPLILSLPPIIVYFWNISSPHTIHPSCVSYPLRLISGRYYAPT